MAESGGSQSPPPPDLSVGGGLSQGRAYVRSMADGIGADYLMAVAAVARHPSADLDLVAVVAETLAGRLALAERAQHGHECVGVGRGQSRIGQDGGFDVVDRGTDRHPPEAA